MKKTFDEICAGILGEMVTPNLTAPGQPPKTAQQNQQQPQQNQQPKVDHDELIKNLITNLADKNFVAKVTQNQDLQKALAALQQNTQR